MLKFHVQAGETRTEFSVDFRVNTVRIDQDFGDNATSIPAIIALLDAIACDSTATLTSVTFCGAASPEGSSAWNRHLASRRRGAIENLVLSRITIPDSLIARDDSYIPWNYLREQVAGSDLAQRDSIIAIIDQAPEEDRDPDSGRPVDRRIVLLKQMEGRRVWNELFRRYFSKMRNACAVVVVWRDDVRRTPDAGSTATLPGVSAAPQASAIHTPSVLVGNQPGAARKPFYMAIWSNLLYDALATPNIGAEFYLGKDLSISGSWMHAWWSYDRRHRYWRIYGADLTLRRWFGAAAGRKPLTGHHIGIYAQALTYDFEFGGTACMGGKPGGTILDRAHFGGGVEYGYSLPVSRRLNLNFCIGVGYIGGKVYKFVPDGDRYLWKSTRHFDWFGPTRLEVSLVWLIGRGNFNPTEGGER